MTIRFTDASLIARGIAGHPPHLLPVVLGYVILALLLTAAAFVRLPDLKETTGARNLEAPYHVLLTLAAWQQTPVTDHWLLPTVTLGKPTDKNISWGGTVPSAEGNYIYTSFTPPGFIAPYAWFSALSLSPTVENLATFNILLGSLAALFLFMLLMRLLSLLGVTPSVAVGSSLAAVLIALFSREALTSHGLIYWSHSLYQPFLIGTLLALVHFLARPPDGRAAPLFWLLVGLAFVGALIEWSAYVFNLGLVAVAVADRGHDKHSMRLALAVLTATALAGLTILVHYALVLGIGPTLHAMLARFLDGRDSASKSILELLLGYRLSYGLFLAAVALLGATALFAQRSDAAAGRPHRIVGLALVAASIPLLENLLLLQHATVFTFDRLKFIPPAALTMALALACLQARERAIATVFLIAASIQGYVAYKGDLALHGDWAEIDRRNRALARQVSQAPEGHCGVLHSNIRVRGYANLLFDRGIHEISPIQDGPDLLRASNACAAVFLEGSSPFMDLPAYSRVVITHRDGRQIILVPPSKG